MKIIEKYFPALDDLQKYRFSQLQDLYETWNNKINVISRKDINSLYEKHVLHSLSIARFFTFSCGTTLVDIGTGGGFPGIPLAIFFPDCRFLLVDSIGKKIKVVNEISNAIGLENIETKQVRVEKLGKKFDFVVSRAVTSFPVFYNWTRTLVSGEAKNKFSNGIIYLKGGDFEKETARFKVKTFHISEVFEEPFFETKKIIYLPAK